MNINRIHIHPTTVPAVDFDSVETRLTLLELANYARTNQSGTAKFVELERRRLHPRRWRDSEPRGDGSPADARRDFEVTTVTLSRPAPGAEIVRLKNGQGCDELNIEGISYRPDSTPRLPRTAPARHARATDYWRVLYRASSDAR